MANRSLALRREAFADLSTDDRQETPVPSRRLALAREVLTPLQSDELASIAAAHNISNTNPLCTVALPSLRFTACATCYCPPPPQTDYCQ